MEPANIVYEDEELLILHKEPGVPSVPLRPDEKETAVSQALAHFPGLSSIGRAGLEPGILHRLDTRTSGLLVFAKTQSRYNELYSLWKTSAVRKWYRAICGPDARESSHARPVTPPAVDQELAIPLGHSAKSSKRMLPIRSPADLRRIRGKALPAFTRIQDLRAISMAGTETAFDLTLEIRTGVMHQIRCHLASIGWPVLGDQTYHGSPGSPAEELFLHAWRIELPLEKKGARLLVEARLPDYWPP